MQGKTKYLVNYVVWAADIVAIVISFVLATYIRFWNFRDMQDKTMHFIICILMVLICTVYTFAIDANRGFLKRTIWKEGTAVAKFEFVLILGTIAVAYILKLAEQFSRLVMFYFIIFDVVLTLAFHQLVKFVLKKYWESGDTAIKLLVVSEKEIMMPTIRHLQHRLEINYSIEGAVCLDEDMSGEEIRGVKIIANRENLIDTVTSYPVDEIFIYTPNISQNALNETIAAFGDMGVTVHYCVELPNIAGSTSVGNLATYSVISYIHGTERYRALILKRLMDIVGGLVGLIITAVFTPFVALAIKLDSPGPVFFSQVRIGRNGRRFKIYKFRSMRIDAEEIKKKLENQNEMNGLMFKMKDDPRITKVGAFIRKTSIDELPQFLNIFKGDMSLVGTRPPTEDEFEKYNQYYRRRISMTPGLTGMWQISGRSDIEDFDDVVKLDLQYIDNWSLGLDIRILIKTVGVVLFGRGAR
ncbi:sugar transferase [Butyrivibrio sp. AC2005]|uniref:sugar transferase n=1 Tax=Butyrivibrio sp. AC2005 TaxID=1280672 RepID=UPI000422AE8E|nr:sugar transferase [Butyrivibrio sp. AC2005]